MTDKQPASIFDTLLRLECIAIVRAQPDGKNQAEINAQAVTAAKGFAAKLRERGIGHSGRTAFYAHGTLSVQTMGHFTRVDPDPHRSLCVFSLHVPDLPQVPIETRWYTALTEMEVKLASSTCLLFFIQEDPFRFAKALTDPTNPHELPDSTHPLDALLVFRPGGEPAVYLPGPLATAVTT